MKQTTLLAKAKAHKSNAKTAYISQEELDLCLAWLMSEISTTQAGHALNKAPSNIALRVAIVLRQACTKGRLIVKKTKSQ